MLEAGNHLGYLRLLAEELDAVKEDDVAGLLATVPVHVPVAVGSLPDTSVADPTRPTWPPGAHRWSELIDRMLEHPLARAHRLATGG